MKRNKDLWPQICSFENIADAARETLRGKRNKGAGARFFADWEREVVRLERELREGSYLPGAYHYFRIHEPKERVVAAAPFRDRVVHHALVRVIEPLFEPRFIEVRPVGNENRGGAFCRRAMMNVVPCAIILHGDFRPIRMEGWWKAPRPMCALPTIAGQRPALRGGGLAGAGFESFIHAITAGFRCFRD